MKILKMDEQAATRSWLRVSCPVWTVVLVLLCFVLSTQQASAQKNTSTVQGPSETTKLVQEREEIRSARYKLLQEESTFHAQYLKPLDRIRRQLNAQEADLYAECSDGKDFRNPQYAHCIQDLNRFNDDVKYYNERLDELSMRLSSQKKQFRDKSDDLGRREKEIDRKIKSLQDRSQR
jgi:predicted  nucleic acid-binding Zn-ribbon protein